MTKEQILEEMKEIMPFSLLKQTEPYILEAMQVYADKQCNIGGVSGRTFTNEELQTIKVDILHIYDKISLSETEVHKRNLILNKLKDLLGNNLMKRPNKKDYDFNDNIEGVRYAKDMNDYADWLEKQCNIGGGIECLRQVNSTLERHGKIDANADLHNRIRNTL